MNCFIKPIPILVYGLLHKIRLIILLFLMVLTVTACDYKNKTGLKLVEAKVPRLDYIAPSQTIPNLYGSVPYQVLVKSLAEAGLVEAWVADPMSQVTLWGPDNLQALRSQLRLSGLLLESKRLTFAQALSSREASTSDGFITSPQPVSSRTRALVVFEFFKIGSGVTLDTTYVGTNVIRFQSVFTPGSQLTFSSTSERSYTSNISVGETDSFVSSSRETVSAGLNFTGVIGILEHMVRFDGVLIVSSFAGATLDRATVSVPVDFDAQVGEPVIVQRISGADLRVALAFADFSWDGLVSADDVCVRVCVYPLEDLDDPMTVNLPTVNDSLILPPPDGRTPLQPELTGNE